MTKNKKQNGGWFEIGKTFLWALVLASVFRTLAFDPYHIPSGSMFPNLLIGDFVIVSKYSYGYSQYSSWPIPLPLFEGRFLESQPERGDVAVFRVPQNSAGKKIYIKRVVGLPGDKIQMQDGKLFINGVVQKNEDVGSYSLDGENEYFRKQLETLENGVSYNILDEFEGAPLDDTEEFVVPEGNYFMMGDNRDNSEDSRASLGLVPAENLIGRAEIVLFSSEGMIWNITEWRGDRFFVNLRN